MNKKSNQWIAILIGLGVVGGAAYYFREDIKALFSPKDDTKDDKSSTDEQQSSPPIQTLVPPNTNTIQISSQLSPIGTPKSKLNFDVKLKQGDKGAEVLKAQEILNRIASYTKKQKITEDGDFGIGTETRLKDLFTTGTANLYQLYTALFSIFDAKQKKQFDKWFDTYLLNVSQPYLYKLARSNYFKTEKSI